MQIQWQIQSKPHQERALNPLKDTMKVKSIDYSGNVNNMITKIEKLEKLYDTGKMDFNLVRYIPGLTDIAYQGQIYFLQTKRKYASEIYAQKKQP